MVQSDCLVLLELLSCSQPRMDTRGRLSFSFHAPNNKCHIVFYLLLKHFTFWWSVSLQVPPSVLLHNHSAIMKPLSRVLILLLSLPSFQPRNQVRTPPTSCSALRPWLASCCWVWLSLCLAVSTYGSSDTCALDVANRLRWAQNRRRWRWWCEPFGPWRGAISPPLPSHKQDYLFFTPVNCRAQLLYNQVFDVCGHCCQHRFYHKIGWRVWLGQKWTERSLIWKGCLVLSMCGKEKRCNGFHFGLSPLALGVGGTHKTAFCTFFFNDFFIFGVHSRYEILSTLVMGGITRQHKGGVIWTLQDSTSVTPNNSFWSYVISCFLC